MNRRRKHIPKNAVLLKEDSVCNICQASADLTLDHVPPKKCLKAAVQLSPLRYHVYPLLDARPEEMVLTQSGIRFRTICATCNNRLLGAQFDDELGRLADHVRRLLHLARHIYIPGSFLGDAERIIKAVFGHLLAACPTAVDVGHDRQMRSYVLGETSAPGIKLHFWIARSHDIRIFRHYFVTHGRDRQTYCHLLQFFPFGFLATDAHVPFDSFPLDELLPQVGPSRIPLIDGRNYPFERWWSEKQAILLGTPGRFGVHAIPA